MYRKTRSFGWFWFFSFGIWSFSLLKYRSWKRSSKPQIQDKTRLLIWKPWVSLVISSMSASRCKPRHGWTLGLTIYPCLLYQGAKNSTTKKKRCHNHPQAATFHSNGLIVHHPSPSHFFSTKVQKPSVPNEFRMFSQLLASSSQERWVFESRGTRNNDLYNHTFLHVYLRALRP